MTKQCRVVFIAKKEKVGYSAKAHNLPIFIQGDTKEELNKNAREAINLHFADDTEYSSVSYQIAFED